MLFSLFNTVFIVWYQGCCCFSRKYELQGLNTCKLIIFVFSCISHVLIWIFPKLYNCLWWLMKGYFMHLKPKHTHSHTQKHAHKHCISIGKIPTCQPSQPQPPHSQPWYCFTGWESFGPFGFVVIKKFSLYFILLFVGKHLKEIEGLNGRRVCIHPAVQKDCMEEQPICWEAGWGCGGCPGEGMP